MTARYTHATDEAKRRAVETLATKPQVGNDLATERKRLVQASRKVLI
jgi:hypothetical protein